MVQISHPYMTTGKTTALTIQSFDSKVMSLLFNMLSRLVITFLPSFPSPSAGDLRELPGVPLRGEGSCGGGGAPRDSAGSGATEEGLTESSGQVLCAQAWKPSSQHAGEKMKE